MDSRSRARTTTSSSPSIILSSKVTLLGHDNRWRQRRQRSFTMMSHAESKNREFITHQQGPHSSNLLFLKTNSSLLVSYLILLLAGVYVVTPAQTLTPSITTSSLTSDLAFDRIKVVRQPVSNPSGSYRQTTKNFKELYDKITIHVKENTPIGTKLADIQPRDSDSGHLPLLHPGLGSQQQQQQSHFADQETLYKIMPNDDAHLFTIRKDDRKIELVNEVNFDYESPKKAYSLFIRATSIYFRYECEVEILVMDENDNKPQLDDFAIVFNNYKNHFPTGPIGRVPATDLDVSDVLRFQVLSGNNAQLIIVNETNGDIQLSPELNGNVPFNNVLMDIAVSDGINEAKAKLVLTVNMVTESMLHNSVVLRVDGLSRDDFLTQKYDIFLSQLAKLLGLYKATDIVVFDVEESHHSLDLLQQQQQQQQLSPAGDAPAAVAAASATTVVQQTIPGVGYRTAYSTHSMVTNASQTYVNISFSARADGNEIEAYLSRQYIEERIHFHRLLLSHSLGAQVAPFQDDICVQEPCQNYQECQVTYRFDKAPKVFLTERNMIFRQIKASQSFTCLCPATFTGMKNKNECNLQINQCYTNPCLNGGQCHRHESGYTCQCRGDYFGARCEHSFMNSTCQSISAPALRTTASLFGPSATSMSNHIQVDALESSYSYSPASSSSSSKLSSAAMCSGKSRCVNLSKIHPHYYQKLSSGASSQSIASASANSPVGFACQGCSYASQWTNDLCQLRARSFDQHSYVSLPSLRRRHRFHLMLQFATVQNDALLLYNGRYNDKHDFIALEIVDSHLRFSYSLGGSGASGGGDGATTTTTTATNQVFTVSLADVPVSDGEWHRVTIDYRDRNVTLMVDDCDPILDEALARHQQLINGGGGGSTTPTTRRCSNTTTSGGKLDQASGYHMLDLTSPLQLGALPLNLISGTNGVPTNLLADLSAAAAAAATGADHEHPVAWSHLAHMGANSFSGCMSDLHIDHQLIDLSAPLQDYGTHVGCSDKRSFCEQNSCSGYPCQDSFGSARCQCPEDRLGKSCELHLSQEKVRKFSGNSYLTFNPIESRIPPNWLVSLHFRSNNPSGVLFKISLDTDTSIVLELSNGGLRLSHRLRQLTFNKLLLDDGEWHFVELTWTSEHGTSMQVDYNPNLIVQSSDLGQVAGATMRSVIVGAASSRSASLLSSAAAASPASDLQDSAAAPVAQSAVPPAVAAVAPDASASEFGGGLTSSTALPPLTTPGANGELPASDDAYAYLYGVGAGSLQSNGSQSSFVGCIYALNISDNVEWWQSPNEERNVERGCPVLDPCEVSPCPANSRCQRRGMNQRRCVCNPGYVGDSCVPVCDLQPCRGENSRCIPASSSDALTRSNTSNSSNHSEQQVPLPTSGALTSSSLSQLAQQQHYTCECEAYLSGKNCEHQLSPRCPANWWGKPLSPGRNSSICGPCNCDESRGFDGDCDKLTGQCHCKLNHYQPSDSDQCLACDCYAIGSLSASCNQTSGQCKCRPGVVGRRCDTCASPYAEVTLRGCEVIYDACPKTFSDGIWWDKTQLDQLAVQQCPPSTSTGRATRVCHKTEGWQKANLFDCISNTFAELYTQFLFLEENKFQMSTQLAMKIANNLRQALNETVSSSSSSSSSAPMQLYGSDMYISFRLVHHLVQHESHQQGLNLTHRQDRAYIRNLVESVSYILDPAYAENWPEIAARSPNGGAEYLLKLLDDYGKILIDSQLDTFTQPFEVSAKHLTFGMDTLSLEQLYDLSGKWSLPGATGSGLGGSLSSSIGHSSFPSSPPYATDPFEMPLSSPSSPFGLSPGGGGGGSGRHTGTSPTDPAHSTTQSHFQPDGTSIYLDFSATRDASPSVIIPKYDNYPASSSADGPPNNGASGTTQTKALIPLKTLKMRAPKEASNWLSGARSRAKRNSELVIPDYLSMRAQRPPVVVYSIYKTLGPLLPANYDNTVQNRLGMLATANSPVVWLTIRPQNSTEFLGKSVQPKITYMLKMLEPMGKTRPQCAIWDFTSQSSSAAVATSAVSAAAIALQNKISAATSKSNATSASGAPLGYGIKQTGRYTTRGCELKTPSPSYRLGGRHKYDHVNCSCDHLGAVVLLMDSAAGSSYYDYLAGDDAATNTKDLWLMISLGCSLALLCATLFVLSCIRGHSIKCNSNSINKNIIVILVLIELLILYSIASRGSLNQREYQCKLVAIFLHYFTVSLFFWLLVNAIHFYRMHTELRDINHGPMRFYHVLGYAVPAFFVSLAVGLRMEQFGNYLFCWLSIYEPIIWSMFGPICAASAMIVALFALALCKSLPLDKILSDQDDPSSVDLIKSHMLINIVKTPLIAVYSVMAVYAVNEALDSAYLFPLTIVSKSLLLFVLLCIVDKYIRYNMYVSWLRLKGEKVPFAEESMMTHGGGGHYGLGGPGVTGSGAMFALSDGNLPGGGWLMPEGALGNYGGLGGNKSRAAAGQLLFPMSGGGGNQQQIITPGFQSSCTDIFRPELLAGLSAASTTSRSSDSESSSSAYREYNNGGGHHGHHHGGHSHHHHHRSNELDTEEPDGGYGRSRRHRRRHGGAKKSHRKHHHHHGGGGGGGGRHHHHRHHHHSRSQHQDDYEVESGAFLGSTGDASSSYQQDHYGRSHSHGHHGHNGHGGHHHHHHHHSHRSHKQHGNRRGGGGQENRPRNDDDGSSSGRADDSKLQLQQQQQRQRASDTGSLDQILKNDELLASSHSSDRDDDDDQQHDNARPLSKRDGEQTDIADASSVDPLGQRQTVPMELLVPSTSGGQQQQQQQREEQQMTNSNAKENIDE